MTQPIIWCVMSTLRSAALFAIFFHADHIRCADQLALPPHQLRSSSDLIAEMLLVNVRF
jgi:hypothetical protein